MRKVKFIIIFPLIFTTNTTALINFIVDFKVFVESNPLNLFYVDCFQTIDMLAVLYFS